MTSMSNGDAPRTSCGFGEKGVEPCLRVMSVLPQHNDGENGTQTQMLGAQEETEQCREVHVYSGVGG